MTVYVGRPSRGRVSRSGRTEHRQPKEEVPGGVLGDTWQELPACPPGECHRGGSPAEAQGLSWGLSTGTTGSRYLAQAMPSNKQCRHSEPSSPGMVGTLLKLMFPDPSRGQLACTQPSSDSCVNLAMQPAPWAEASLQQKCQQHCCPRASMG